PIAELIDQLGEPRSAHADVQTVGVDFNPLDEKLHDARLLGWKEFIPNRIESLKRLPYFSLRNVIHRLPCRSPGANNNFGSAKQCAKLVDDRVFDLGSWHAANGTGCAVAFQRIGRDVIAIELSVATRVRRSHGDTVRPENQSLEQSRRLRSGTHTTRART